MAAGVQADGEGSPKGFLRGTRVQAEVCAGLLVGDQPLGGAAAIFTRPPCLMVA